MSLSGDMIAYAIANGLLSQLKKDVFSSRKAAIPSEPKDVGPFANFVETGGADEMLSHSDAYPRPSCQVSVVAASSPIAEAKCRQLHALMKNIHNQTINGTDYMKIRARQEPMDMSPDPVGRPNWVFNLEAEITDFTFELPPLGIALLEGIGIHGI